MIWALAAGLAVLAALVALYLLGRGPRRIVTTHLRLRIPHLPAALHGRRLAFVTDLHYGLLYVAPEDLLAAVESARPDLLLLGGDYAASSRCLGAALELVRALAAVRPTFGVLGNTEHYFGCDRAALAEALAAGGGALLVNESARVAFDGAMVEIIGLDDPDKGGLDTDAALADSSAGAAVRVALVHSPAAWQEVGRLGAHILLCGHTHGGQIRLPLLEAPLTHSHYPPHLAAGLFRYRPDRRPRLPRLAGHWWLLGHGARPSTVDCAPGPLMYVSRGIGTSLAPVRLLCPPELVLIELLPAEDQRTEGAERDG